MFYVYAIINHHTGRIYIGQTRNIKQRLEAHNRGYVRSTAKDRPWNLFAVEELNSSEEARWVERKIKRSRGKRMSWLESHRTTSIEYNR